MKKSKLKSMKKLTLVVMVAALLCCGCGKKSSEKKDAKKELSTTSEKQEDSDKKDTPYVFEYNKYAMPQFHKQFFSEEQYELYSHLVDAIYEHRTEVKTSLGDRDAQDLIDAFCADCPVVPPMTDYGITANGGVITIEYVKSEEECKEIIDKFETSVADIINASITSADMSQDEMMFALYENVAKNTTYALNEGEEILYPYSIIVDKKGYCTLYSRAMLCLFAQVVPELDAREVTSPSAEAGHSWIIAKMEDGKYYHFDVTYECSMQYPEYNAFFGMSDEEREKEDQPAPYSYIGDEFEGVEMPACPDTMSGHAEYEKWLWE